mmetsp:Transcript_20819/g.37950  ORF Transcript_20819/g.37950 Transcript_20819/m.37950 type:complete len:207 (+) Transcript_20819:299-919(+)
MAPGSTASTRLSAESTVAAAHAASHKSCSSKVPSASSRRSTTSATTGSITSLLSRLRVAVRSALDTSCAVNLSGASLMRLTTAVTKPSIASVFLALTTVISAVAHSNLDKTESERPSADALRYASAASTTFPLTSLGSISSRRIGMGCSSSGGLTSNSPIAYAMYSTSSCSSSFARAMDSVLLASIFRNLLDGTPSSGQELHRKKT